MFKNLVLIACAALVAHEAAAASWLKSRGRTREEAFYRAQQEYGRKFVKRGDCTQKQTDGYIYCDVLIED